jgi:Mechanosensitive ion channel, conserved TM helix
MVQSNWFDPLLRYVEQVWTGLLTYLPNLLGAVVLLVVGWLTARLLRAVASRLIPRFYRLLPGRAQRELQASSMDQFTTKLAAGLVYWIVLVLFFAAATDSLRLPVVSTLMGGLARYLPRVLIAVLIIVAAIVFANLARLAVATAAASARIASAELLGRVAQISILLIASLVAIDEVGIESTFLVVFLAVFLGTTVGGIALAFGLGAATSVGNLVAAHHVSSTYRVGQRVRIGDTEGQIMEMTKGAVILETPAGQAIVPARRFSEEVSIILHGGD